MPAIEFPPIRLTFVDGRVETFEIWPADMYRLESKTGQSLGKIGDNMGVTQLLDLVYFAARRTHYVNGDSTMDDFLDQIKEMDILADTPDPPTLPAPGPSIGS